MSMDALMIPDRIGAAIYDALLWPGHFLLAQLVSSAPNLATGLGIDGAETAGMLPLLIALTCWTLLAFMAWICLRLWRNAVRITGSIVRTSAFRMSLRLCGLKTQLVCRLRQLWPQRRANSPAAIPMVEFDNLDLAVLRSAAALAPGFALSAPELADQFSLRPAQVQRSLDRLNKNKMLDYVIGSTDGYDNYRLTESGAAFMAMWQRQQQPAAH